MGLYSQPIPAGYRADPTSGLLLDSRSPWLLQGDTPPTAPGEQQPFPNTAAALIAALGSPAGIVAADVQGAYLCDTATPLVDSLAIGPNLPAWGGGELTGSECVGLGQTGSFISKVGVEFTDTDSAYVGLGSDYGQVPLNAQRSFLFVLRPSDAYDAGAERNFVAWGGPAVVWLLARGVASNYRLFIIDPGLHVTSVPGTMGCEWTYACVTFDDATKTANLFTSVGDAAPVNYVATLVDGAPNGFALGSPLAFGGSALFQCAAMYRIDKLLAKADCDTFWRAFNLNEFSTPCAYTRAGQLCTRITNVFGNVACYGANQPAVGYAANASTATNPLKTGVVCEDGASFLGLGTDNMPAFVGTNAVVTATDGPSGMRDACRVADTDGVNAGFATSGAAVPVGATNVPFIYSAYVKSGGVGTNAVFQSYYTGDGGGPETFTNWTIAGAVGAAWRPFIGLTHTPVGAAHTAVVTYLIPTDNVGASLGTVDFAEVWGRQNAAVDMLAWRRCAAGAASVTSTPSLSYTNVGNARFSPSRGRMRLRVSGFAGAGEVTTSPGSPYPVGAGARPNDICTDGLYQVWTANNNNSTITVYNAATKALRSTFGTGLNPACLCADALGQVWVTCDGANRVYVYDAATLAAIGNYATGANPWGIAADGLGQVWIANFNGNNVTVYDAATKATVGGPYATPNGPRAVAVDDQGQVWVACQTANQVRCFNAATKAVVGTYAVGAAPWFATCDRSNQVWIANTNYGVGTTVTVYNTITKALVGTYTVPGVSPTGMGADAFGRMWIPCYSSSILVALDVTTKALVARLATVSGPGCATIDALGQVWCSNYNNDTIEAYRARPTFLAFGAEGAQGALWADYRGALALAPLFVGAAQLKLRMWDDVAALVCDLECGALTAAEAIRTIEWDAVLGKVGVFNGATLLASYAGTWTPETAVAVAPLYVGSDPTPANAARCHITLLEGFDF